MRPSRQEAISFVGYTPGTPDHDDAGSAFPQSARPHLQGRMSVCPYFIARAIGRWGGGQPLDASSFVFMTAS